MSQPFDSLLLDDEDGPGPPPSTQQQPQQQAPMPHIARAGPGMAPPQGMHPGAPRGPPAQQPQYQQQPQQQPRYAPNIMTPQQQQQQQHPPYQQPGQPQYAQQQQPQYQQPPQQQPQYQQQPQPQQPQYQQQQPQQQQRQGYTYHGQGQPRPIAAQPQPQQPPYQQQRTQPQIMQQQKQQAPQRTQPQIMQQPQQAPQQRTQPQIMQQAQQAPQQRTQPQIMQQQQQQQQQQPQQAMAPQQYRQPPPQQQQMPPPQHHQMQPQQPRQAVPASGGGGGAVAGEQQHPQSPRKGSVFAEAVFRALVQLNPANKQPLTEAFQYFKNNPGLPHEKIRTMLADRLGKEVVDKAWKHASTVYRQVMARHQQQVQQAAAMGAAQPGAVPQQPQQPMRQGQAPPAQQPQQAQAGGGMPGVAMYQGQARPGQGIAAQQPQQHPQQQQQMQRPSPQQQQPRGPMIQQQQQQAQQQQPGYPMGHALPSAGVNPLAVQPAHLAPRPTQQQAQMTPQQQQQQQKQQQMAAAAAARKRQMEAGRGRAKRSPTGAQQPPPQPQQPMVPNYSAYTPPRGQPGRGGSISAGIGYGAGRGRGYGTYQQPQYVDPVELDPDLLETRQATLEDIPDDLTTLEEHKVIVVEEERTLLEDVPVEEVADDEDRDPEAWFKVGVMDESRCSSALHKHAAAYQLEGQALPTTSSFSLRQKPQQPPPPVSYGRDNPACEMLCRAAQDYAANLLEDLVALARQRAALDVKRLQEERMGTDIGLYIIMLPDGAPSEINHYAASLVDRTFHQNQQQSGDAMDVDGVPPGRTIREEDVARLLRWRHKQASPTSAPAFALFDFCGLPGNEGPSAS